MHPTDSFHPAAWLQAPLPRRRLLRAMTAGGVATFMGMPLRGLFGREAQAGSRRPARADAVILLWMGGGMSHLDTLDPKPGAPTGGEFTAIRTAVDGVRISEILPTVAAQLGHATLVRSITGESADHGNATHHLLTSYPRVRELVHPSLGSIVADQAEKLGDLPAFVSIGGEAPSPGYLGQTAEAYFIGEPGAPDPTIALPEGITQVRAQRRLEILEGLNGRFPAPGEPLAGAVGGSYAAAVQLMRSPALAAFDVNAEPAAVRAAYGDTRFGRGCLLARRLVEHGVRFVQVNLGGFDTHVDNFPAMRSLGAIIDPAIGTLLRELAASGRLDRTLVLLLSEFGRTPVINGTAGRDHYPDVFSGLVAGGGIRRGFVLGGTDPEGRQAVERPVKVADLHATVVDQLGIDPDRQVDTPLGRRMKLVNNGTILSDLLG
ncbi:MAG: DUF1501 domain-containing protein [Planctomycetia bacterium]